MTPPDDHTAASVFTLQPHQCPRRHTRSYPFPTVIARRRSRRGNPVPSSRHFFPPHRQHKARNLWISTSDLPPRNDALGPAQPL